MYTPNGGDAAHISNFPTRYHWLPGEERVAFSLLEVSEGIGGCCVYAGDWVVDLESGHLERYDGEALTRPDQPPGYLSPDGRYQVIIGNTGLSLADSQGELIWQDLLTYPRHYRPDITAPIMRWMDDSETFFALVLEVEDPYEQGATFSTWVVPVDGNPAVQTGIYEGYFPDVYISPNNRYFAYWRAEPSSNYRHLYLAMIDGSETLHYSSGEQLKFLGWNPDSIHFVWQSDGHSLQYGSVCGGSSALTDSQDVPVEPEIYWLDAKWYLYVNRLRSGQRELRLGLVDGESFLIGPYNGENVMFEVVEGNKE